MGRMMLGLGIVGLSAVAVSLPSLAAPRDIGSKHRDAATFEIADGVQMAFCWVPPGTGTLGAPDAEQGRESKDLAPREYKARGFWLGKYEVTQREWMGVMRANPSRFAKTGAGAAAVPEDTGAFPVDSVSREDCLAFLAKLNERGAARAAFGTGGKFVLPTEDEWEYACRGGKGNADPFYWGKKLDGTQANCRGDAPYGTREAGPRLGRTAAVGSYAKSAPHPWGLCDMIGNVMEWTDSPHTERWYVLRGGSYSNEAVFCRTALRQAFVPNFAAPDFGFRVCFRPD
jgi:formylglycine-generating enzyme required for sulfatase activity